MSLDAMRWAFQQTNLRSSVKFVLVALADRANDDGECWPSRDLIAADTCLNPETVSKATEELVTLGLIEKCRRFGSSDVYRLIGIEARHQSAGKPAKRKNPLSGKSRHQSAGFPATNLPMNLVTNTNKPSKAYAFCGDTLKITSDDLEKIGAQYPNIDLRAELLQLDQELRGKKSWWQPMHAKLNYRNAGGKNGVTANPTGTGGRSSAAGRVREACERERARLAAEGHN